MRIYAFLTVLLLLLHKGLAEEAKVIEVTENPSSATGSSSSPSNNVDIDHSPPSEIVGRDDDVAQHREDTSGDNDLDIDHMDQMDSKSNNDGGGGSTHHHNGDSNDDDDDQDAAPSVKHNNYQPPPSMMRDIPLSLPTRSGSSLLPPGGPQPHLIHAHSSNKAPPYGNHFQNRPPPPPQLHGPPGLPKGGLPPPPPQVNEAAQDKLFSTNEIWSADSGDAPKILNLDVKCERNSMKVHIAFDKPFFGVIFSKGHYSNAHCVHLPAGLGRTSATFDINIHACGTTGNTENGLYGYGADSGSGTFFENIVVIQYDPQVQEVWDQARKLRCTWHDQYEKSVTFRPFPVDMLDVVRADFAGDNVGCWMQIQVGKGPWASEVSGLVKIGQTMTMVLAIKDDDGKFDMLVRNCVAHDGKRAPIQLVDQKGCVTRSKLMSKFTKIKNFGASASVLSYAHFQAFKFPDSMEVHFQCTIQICRYQCPEQCSDLTNVLPAQHESVVASHHGSVKPDSIYGAPLLQLPQKQPQPPLDLLYLHGNGYVKRDGRRVRNGKYKRDVGAPKAEEIGVNRIIKVVSTGDLTFSLDDAVNSSDATPTMIFPTQMYEENVSMICMTSANFSATLVFLLTVLFISCLISSVMCIKVRANKLLNAKVTNNKQVVVKMLKMYTTKPKKASTNSTFQQPAKGVLY